MAKNNRLFAQSIDDKKIRPTKSKPLTGGSPGKKASRPSVSAGRPAKKSSRPAVSAGGSSTSPAKATSSKGGKKASKPSVTPGYQVKSSRPSLAARKAKAAGSSPGKVRPNRLTTAKAKTSSRVRRAR